jgi:hypothetical protein
VALAALVNLRPTLPSALARARRTSTATYPAPKRWAMTWMARHLNIRDSGYLIRALVERRGPWVLRMFRKTALSDNRTSAPSTPSFSPVVNLTTPSEIHDYAPYLDTFKLIQIHVDSSQHE